MKESDNHVPEGVQEIQEIRRKAAAFGAALPGTYFAGFPQQFGPDTDWPEDLRHSPVIIDTDIGGDPAGALALVAAARTIPQLAMVITPTEVPPSATPGRRARLARMLLDGLHRADVTVVEGTDLATTPFCMEDLPIPTGTVGTDVVSAVQSVCAATAGPVRWVGMSSLTHLAEVLDRAPQSAVQLRVTQLSEPLQRAGTAVDQDSAVAVLQAVAERRLLALELITAEITGDSAIAVGRGSAIHQSLAGARGSGWAALLAAHLDRWYDRSAAQSRQQGALALATALDLPFVVSADTQAITSDSRIHTVQPGHAADGVRVRASVSALYAPFMDWLARALDPRRPEPSTTDTSRR
jgi:hypothetical protein